MLIEMQDWDGNKTRVVINNLIIGTEAFRLLYVPTLYSVPENLIYAFPEMKLRGLIPNSYIHVSERFIFPVSVCLFGCCKSERPILGIYKFLTVT